MSIHVHIPIRLRIDAFAIETGSAELDEALAVALDRALARAGAAALDARPGATLRLHVEPAHWKGTAVDLIGPQLRRRTELRLHAGIAAALARRPKPARESPNVLPSGPWEPFDPDRVAADGYLVDSYQPSASRRPGQSVLWFRSKVEVDAVLAGDETAGWWDYSDDASLGEHARRVIDEALKDGSIARGGPVGVLYRRRSSRGNNLWAAIFRGAGSTLEVVTNFPIGNPVAYDVEPRKGAKGGTKPTPRAITADPLGIYRLELLSGRPHDAFLRFWGARLGIPDSGHPLWMRMNQATSSILANAMFPEGNAALLWLDAATPITVTVPAGLAGDHVLLLPLAKVRKKLDPEQNEAGDPAEGGEGGQAKEGGGGNDQRKSAAKDGAGGGGRAAEDGGEGGPVPADGGGGGAGEGAGGDPDAVVRAGGDGRQGGALLPQAKIRGKYRPDLRPFQGEPSVDVLGDVGRRMRLLIQRISFRLEMAEGPYPGAFALAAAKVVGGRATGAADYGIGEGQAIATRPSAPGNLGTLQFETGESQAIRVMQHLAGTVPLINELARLVLLVALDERYRRFFAANGSNPGSWALHFRIAYYNAIQSSIMWTFVATCQTILLQLTSATRAALQERKDKIDLYYPMLDKLIGGLMAGEARLRDYRAKLQAHEALHFGSTGAVLRQGYETWREARAALMSSLGAMDENEAMLNDLRHDAPDGVIVPLPDGSSGIMAGGRIWRMAELEQAIATRFEIAASIDPIVKHISDLSVAVGLFRSSPAGAKAWLSQLLDDLIAANVRVTTRAEESALWSFRASRLREDLAHRTIPGTGVALQGVHMLAHEALGPMFGGDEWYGYALDHLFSHELGRASLLEFASMAGPLVLGVLCPPLGLALNIGISAVGYYYARQDQDIPKAILDPDLVLSRAEAEMELFMKEFQLALAVIPEMGPILGKSAGVLSKVVSRGPVAGARLAGQQLRRQVLVAMARELKQGLPMAFAKAIATDQAMGFVIGKVLEPAFNEVMAEISFAATGTTGAAVPPGSVDSGPPLSRTEAELLFELEGTPESEDDE